MALVLQSLFEMNGIEDKELSQRVEFRVITKTRDKIVKIIEEINEDDYRF